MINQAVNSVDKKIFAPFQPNGVNYAIAKPFTETQIQENKQEENKKESSLGRKIAKFSLLGGFGLLILLGGISKKGRDKVDRMYNHLRTKINMMNEGKQDTLFKKIYVKTLKTGIELIRRSKAVFNMAPLKDVAVKKALSKVSWLDKAGQKITNFFEKVSVKTSRKAYEKSQGKIGSMLALMDDIDAKIANKLSPEEKQELIDNKSTIKKAFETFDVQEQNKRLKAIKKDFYGIDEEGNKLKRKSLAHRVWEQTWGHINNFSFNKNNKSKMYETFIPEWLVREEKAKLNLERQEAKIQISNDLRDNHKHIKKIVENLYLYDNTNSSAIKDVIKVLNNRIARYENAVADKKMRKDILINKAIKKDLQDLRNLVSENKCIDKEITNELDGLIQTVEENRKGAVQRSLDIYRKHLDIKEYKQVKNKMYKSVNSLNHSIKLEDELFDKIRDLSIGSAPKDTLAVIGSAGIVAWGLSKADSKDEKISVALKYGIPTIGAVATALYCTVGLVSGGGALLIGLASGVAISKVGVFVDSIRKKYKEKELTLDKVQIPDSIVPTKYAHKLAHNKSSLEPTNKSGS